MLGARTLFSWLHLSDIHVGAGASKSHWDQSLILSSILRDLDVFLEHSPPEVILVTGDIAFSGGGKDPSEYRKAGQWIKDVVKKLGRSDSDVYCVPGNHDVQRVKREDRASYRLVDGIREGREDIDDAISGDDLAALIMRERGYRGFAKQFGSSIPDAQPSLAWVQRRGSALAPIKLIGVDTAVLANDEDDKGRLFLGKAQIAALSETQTRDEIVILLSHHPLSWLGDAAEASNWVRSRADIHLCGHVHDSDTEALRKGGGKQLITITAGAVHSDERASEPVGHGYSYGAIVAFDDGQRAVRVWPRKWSAKRAEFIVDGDNVDPGETYAQHLLAPSRFPKSESTRSSEFPAPIEATTKLSSSAVPVSDSAESDAPPVSPAWVGRQDELELLSDPSLKLIAVTGIGGQGKSALVAKFLENSERTKTYEFCDWRDCREQGDTFQTHLLRIIERISGDGDLVRIIHGQHVISLVAMLFRLVGTRRILFVFDNIDHYIDSESRQATGALGALCASALKLNHNCRFIMTCRPVVAYEDSTFFQVALSGLNVADTRALFSARGAETESPKARREIANAQMLTHGHPLWLTLIATQVAKGKVSIESLLTDIRNGRADDLPHTTLRSIWKVLNNRQKILLSVMAEAVRPETERQLANYVKGELTPNDFRKTLKSLRAVDLIVTKKSGSRAEYLELHPLVKTFARAESVLPERKKFIDIIAATLDALIGSMKPRLARRPSFHVLEHWTLRAELAVNANDFRVAVEHLHDVESLMLSAGYAEEFIRAAGSTFRGIDWDAAILEEYPHLDSVFDRFVDCLSYQGRFAEADEMMGHYASAIDGKGARYICLCQMKSYSYWLRKDYEKAIDWGQKGVALKKSSGIDTVFDCRHNLALAQRDAGQVDAALAYFLKGVDLSSVLAGTVKRDETFFGNVGRCLWFLGKPAEALICYKISFRLLESGENDDKMMNRAWIRMWLGEVLEKTGEAPMARCFFQAAEQLWRALSPMREEEAGTAATRLAQLIPPKELLDVGRAEAMCKDFVARK